MDVLARCAAAGCGHAVLRHGPGPTRRYCDSTCASRTRVAAHRANRGPAPRPPVEADRRR
ncbi:CGNR zinc finger domain-containing protein [Micromonospora zhanjiangensis]